MDKRFKRLSKESSKNGTPYPGVAPRSRAPFIRNILKTTFLMLFLAAVLASVNFDHVSAQTQTTRSMNTGTESTEVSPDFAAYDFTLKSFDGKTKIRLGNVIEENYAVVVFWAANCPICDFAMPYVALYDDFLGERGIEDVKLIAVALDARVGDPLKKALKEQWTFEIVHDPMGRDTKKAYRLEEKGIPACFVFNKRGYIITTIYGFDKKFTQNIQDAVNADRQSQGGHDSVPNLIIEN